MRERGTFLASFALLLLQVASQTSNVTTCTPLYQWSLNSKNQTPCLVAAFLESVCEGPVNVDTIPENNHYTGPILSGATLCRCSTVTYSLISACGACQGRKFISWTEWATNCSQVEVGQFLQTIPSQVVVPPWAYLDVTKTDNIFNPILANQSLSASASASVSSISATSSASVAPTLSSTIVTLPSTAPTSLPHKKSNAGAIAGGVVGGLIFVVAVGLAVLFCLRRRRSLEESERFPSSFSTSPPPTQERRSGPQSITPFPYPSPHEPFAKDQFEEETVPGSPGTSAVYTTFDTPSITTPAVQILHRYSGAEL